VGAFPGARVALVLIVAKLVINGAGLGARTVKELDGLAFLLFPVLFAVIPVTLTMVLVRYRLWDIDRVINQTLVYGTLIGVLGVVYVASVVLLQDLLRPFTPQSNFIVAASTPSPSRPCSGRSGTASGSSSTGASTVPSTTPPRPWRPSAPDFATRSTWIRSPTSC
jgi:hypothetical protein